MNGPRMELDLGTEFSIRLYDLSENDVEYTTEQFITALEATTDLTRLTVSFSRFTPTPDNNRRVIEPLCRCISNLRRHNQNHSLRYFALMLADDLVENGTLNVLERFLVAAKHCGVHHMTLSVMDGLPVQLLEKFCLDNNSLNSLTLRNVSLAAKNGTTTSLPINDRPQDSAVILSLETLNLEDLEFRNSKAATKFANMLAHMRVRSLVLGKISAQNDNDSDDENVARTERIVSTFKWPTAKFLDLQDTCQLDHFKTALEDGQTSVHFLFVYIDCCEYTDNDAPAKLNLLAGFFSYTVKLKMLQLRTRVHPPPDFFQAMEACATVSRIEMRSDGRVSEEQRFITDQNPDDCSLFEQHLEVMLKRGIATTHMEIMTRNRLLANFVANPSYLMPIAMPLFTNCPTGRYMMARCLPPVVPFHDLASAVQNETKKRKRSDDRA